MKKKWYLGLILFMVLLAAACIILMTGDYSYDNDSEMLSGQTEVLPSKSQAADFGSSIFSKLSNYTVLNVQLPPEIIISVDGLSLNYIVQKTRWNGKETLLTVSDYYNNLTKDNAFIPTFHPIDIGADINTAEAEEGTDSGKNIITIDFGNMIPEDIRIYDDMLNDEGEIRYNGSTTQTKYSQEGSQVKFCLQQHMSYYLSSNSKDYERDWLRLFRIVCKWGYNECTYTFIMNTGQTEELTKIADHNFLDCEGTYSLLSSTLGINLTLYPERLPEQYIVEWQTNDGILTVWNNNYLSSTRPPVKEKHHGYPMTRSGNSDSVLWRPFSFNKKIVSIKAYIYEKEEDKSPVAVSELQLENKDGVYQKTQAEAE